MSSREIIVIYKEVGKEPDLVKIRNTKESFEKLIGGEMEIIPYADIEIICRKNRKNLKPNIYLNVTPLRVDFSIRGNVIIARKEENQYKTLTKKQVFKHVKLLKEESFDNKKMLPARELSRNNTKTKLELEKIVFSGEEYKSEEVLKMILGIQSIILQFIKEDADTY